MFVDMEDMDLEIDAISLEKSIDKICMNTTAEVIVIHSRDVESCSNFVFCFFFIGDLWYA